MANDFMQRLDVIQRNSLDYSGWIEVVHCNGAIAFRQAPTNIKILLITHFAFCAAVFGLVVYAMFDLLPYPVAWILTICYFIGFVVSFKSTYTKWRIPHTFFLIDMNQKLITDIRPIYGRNVKEEMDMDKISSFYLWQTLEGDTHYNSIYAVDNQDKTVVLLRWPNASNWVKTLALDLGYLCEKPVWQRATDGELSQISPVE